MIYPVLTNWETEAIQMFKFNWSYSNITKPFLASEISLLVFDS